MGKINKELFDVLIKSKKEFQNDFELPRTNEKKSFELKTDYKNIKIFLDIHRSGRIELKKCTIQDRYKSVPLIRIDIDSPPHRDKNNNVSSRNHIHIYNPITNENDTYNLEDFNDNIFNDISNFNNIFFDFCSYCNIKIPNTQGVI